MILLTLLESSLFFAAGILHFLLNFKELLPIRDKKSFRRLSQGFLFFSVLLYSAKLANNFLNLHSLMILLFSNIFLYFKTSAHININLFTKDYMLERMVYICSNMLFCVALILIVYWKKNLYSQLT